MGLRGFGMMLRRRWLMVAFSTVVVALAALWVALQKAPVYRATAVIALEASPVLSGPGVEILAHPSPDGVETQVRVITSTPVLQAVARRLGRVPSGEAAAPPAMLEALAGQIRAARLPGTSVIEISASSPDPARARDLANAAAEAYRDHARSVRGERIRGARAFIEGQLDQAEARVRAAEEAVWSYRREHGIIAPGGESGSLLAMITSLRAEADRTQRQRAELEVARTQLAHAEGPGDAGRGSEADRVAVDSANPALWTLQAAQVELRLERRRLARESGEPDPRRQALDAGLSELRSEMRREVAAQVAVLRTREDILRRHLDDLLRRHGEMPAIELGLERLQRDARLGGDLLALLRTRHQEALIEESELAAGVALVRPASEGRPPGPAGTLVTVVPGALLGFLLGLVLALARETLDTAVDSIEDVERDLGVRVLGVVPHVEVREASQALLGRWPALADAEPEALPGLALLVTSHDPRSPFAQAYRTLRTGVRFAGAGRRATVLMLVSATSREGTTTTVVNLALTMAQHGQKTLLVGANLRRPAIHRLFGIDRAPGLADVLLGHARWRDCLRAGIDVLAASPEMADALASPCLDNLHLVEAGAPSPDPAELLSRPAIARFLREAREEYDVVLLDASPALAVPDASIIGAHADGVVLVHQIGAAGRHVLQRARDRVERGGGRVWGVALNDAPDDLASTFSGAAGDQEDRRARLSPRVGNRRAGTGGGGALLVVLSLIGLAGAEALAWKVGWLGAKPQALALPVAAEPRPAAATEPPGASASETWVLELGPFATAMAAERVERVLAATRAPTVRVLRRPGPSVYTVLIEDVGSDREARALLAELRWQGQPDAALVGDRPPFAVRVAERQPLRDAVRIGVRLRALGHRARLVGRPGGGRGLRHPPRTLRRGGGGRGPGGRAVAGGAVEPCRQGRIGPSGRAPGAFASWSWTWTGCSPTVAWCWRRGATS